MMIDKEFYERFSEPTDMINNAMSVKGDGFGVALFHTVNMLTMSDMVADAIVAATEGEMDDEAMEDFFKAFSDICNMQTSLIMQACGLDDDKELIKFAEALHEKFCEKMEGYKDE